MYIHLYLVSDNTFNTNKSWCLMHFMHYQYFKNWYKIIVKPQKYNSIYSKKLNKN